MPWPRGISGRSGKATETRPFPVSDFALDYDDDEYARSTFIGFEPHCGPEARGKCCSAFLSFGLPKISASNNHTGTRKAYRMGPTITTTTRVRNNFSAAAPATVKHAAPRNDVLRYVETKTVSAERLA